MSGIDSDLARRIGDLVRRGFGSGAAVERIAPLAGDASTRRYARAWLTGPSAPATAVVMILADRGIAMSSDELAVLKDAPRELPYVNVHRFLAGLGVAIPALYVDASEGGLLLLEDVGDRPLWDAVQGGTDDEVVGLFGRAIDQLLLIEIDGTARRDDECVAFRQAFDRRLFDWEFEHFLEHGLVQRTVRPIPGRELEELRTHFERLSSFLDAQPRVLNHRDFHAWNLYVQDGRIRVIDFQDALLAPAPYDLATLLGDRDTPAVIRPALEERLLEAYAAAWTARGGAPWSRQQLWDVYVACALQKAFKVVGRFHYLATVKGKPGYLRYLPSTWRQIARLLAARPDLAPVQRILAQYAPELRPVKAMILAAGFGSRLRPLTDRTPKPLIRVNGKPLIAYALAVVRAAGIREVIINVHHRAEQIRAALGSGAAYGVSITYSAEDPILDTGGAIKKAQPVLQDGRFVVLNADSICDIDLRALIAWHGARGALATMVLRADREAARYGIIEIDADDRIRRFLGQPPDRAEPLTPLMFAGIHVFEPDVFRYMDEGRFGITATTYPRLLAAGCPLYGYAFAGYWRVLDTHAGLAEGRWEMLTGDRLAPQHRP